MKYTNTGHEFKVYNSKYGLSAGCRSARRVYQRIIYRWARGNMEAQNVTAVKKRRDRTRRSCYCLKDFICFKLSLFTNDIIKNCRQSQTTKAETKQTFLNSSMQLGLISSFQSLLHTLYIIYYYRTQRRFSTRRLIL